MRKLKFRCWYEFDKSMTYNTCPCKNASGIMMQFTGLLDKSGREIYEGDVIICVGSFHRWSEGNEGDPSVNRCGFDLQAGVVVFRGIEFCLDNARTFALVNDKSVDNEFVRFKENIILGKKNISLYGARYFEVIGNIYENPELLNKGA